MDRGRLESRLDGQVLVARLLDRRPYGATVMEIREDLRDLLANSSARYLVLDFGAVEFFEADLRGVLVWAARELSGRGGRLAICALPEVMRNHPTIEIFGRSLMTIADDPREALRLLSAATDGAGESPS